MEFKKLMTAAALLGAMSFGATTANAQLAYMGEVNTALGTSFNTTTDCIICHASASNATNKDKGITGLAATWKNLVTTQADGTLVGSLSVADQGTLGSEDSDGDGTSNAAEVALSTDFWALPAGDVPGGSSGGCVTASVTTPLMMVLGMLTLGFFVRRKKS